MGFEIRRYGGVHAAIEAMIASALEAIYRCGEDNQFLEVTYANGDNEVLYLKDFISGAMIESEVRRAKTLALKRSISGAEKGLATGDLLAAVCEEIKENGELPSTTNPDDWAKIAGKKGERIIHVKSLVGQTSPRERTVEKVVNTGQYL
jgi:proteasome-associated ATPase